MIPINYRDDHQFSPLHWAAKGGHTKIVEMLVSYVIIIIINILINIVTILMMIINILNH